MTEKTPPIDSRTYLELFSHLSQIIAHTPDLSSLTKASVNIIQAVLMVESCSIMLLDSSSSALTMAASSTIPENMWNRIIVDVGEGVAGQVAATGQPVMVSGFGEHETRSTGSARKYQTKSYITIPLRLGDSIMGVVNVTDRVDRGEFTDFDLEMIVAVGNLIACAISNHEQWIKTEKAHEHLSMVISEIPIGMIAINGDGRITLCNKSATRYLNMSDVTLNEIWTEQISEPIRSHFASILMKINMGRNAFIDDFDITEENGVERSVRISAIVGEHIGALQNREVLFFIEDLQQMKELVELRRSDQMKSNFLSLISHELRTPLASIKGAIHLLNQMESTEFQDSSERIFTVLHRNIDRLTSLVNNILDAMDLDTSSLRLYRKRTDLHELVEKIVKKMEGLNPEKCICWNVNMGCATEGIYVDENRLGQVVEHLLENALKFAPTHGKICLETSSNDSHWLLRVANTGRTIDPSLHEKIFSRFYQIDGTLTRYYGGSGLGLYLCREIVRLHGGEIRIDPVYTEGACFEVSVPKVTELA